MRLKPCKQTVAFHAPPHFRALLPGAPADLVWLARLAPFDCALAFAKSASELRAMFGKLESKLSQDGMERGRGERSAVQELQQEFRIPVIAIATLDDLLAMLGRRAELSRHRKTVLAYREQYGASE